MEYTVEFRQYNLHLINEIMIFYKQNKKRICGLWLLMLSHALHVSMLLKFWPLCFILSSAHTCSQSYQGPSTFILPGFHLRFCGIQSQNALLVLRHWLVKIQDLVVKQFFNHSWNLNQGIYQSLKFLPSFITITFEIYVGTLLKDLTCINAASSILVIFWKPTRKLSKTNLRSNHDSQPLVWCLWAAYSFIDWKQSIIQLDSCVSFLFLGKLVKLVTSNQL